MAPRKDRSPGARRRPAGRRRAIAPSIATPNVARPSAMRQERGQKSLAAVSKPRVRNLVHRTSIRNEFRSDP
jgi:hypothetical protein